MENNRLNCGNDANFLPGRNIRLHSNYQPINEQENEQ